jgi:hypothetical protein
MSELDSQETEQTEWSPEQVAMFPDLKFVSMTDEQLGLPMDLPPEHELSAPEKVFVQDYCVNGMRGGPAAKKAGFKHEYVAASRLLKRPRIQAAIAKELEEILQQGRASKNAFVVRLSGMAHADLGEVLRHLPNPDFIRMDDIRDLPPEISAQIKKIKVNTSERVVKGVAETESSVDIELHEPKGAMELASKLLKYIGDKDTEQNVEIIVRREDMHGTDFEAADPAPAATADQG